MNEISHIPHLNPDAPPFYHDPIGPCPKCRKAPYIDPDNITIHCCILIQDQEGWYQVICAECGYEGIKSSNGNSAIRLFNEQYIELISD